MAAERWCRMSSASTANSDRWATEVAWIKSRGFVGVRVNIALADADSSALAYNATSPNYTNLETVLDLIVSAGLKCQLGLGGDAHPSTLLGIAPLAAMVRRGPIRRGRLEVALESQ